MNTIANYQITNPRFGADNKTNFAKTQFVQNQLPSDTVEISSKKKKNKSKILAGVLISGTVATIGLAAALKYGIAASQKKFAKFFYGNEEVIKALDKSNFNKIKIFEDLSSREKNLVRKELVRSEAPEFFATLAGYKPATLASNVNGLSKIKNNTKFNEIYDVVDVGKDLTYFINKKQLKEIIANNKDIYTLRMNLNKKTSVEEIYDTLIKDGDKYLNSFYGGKNTDLVGITLGFPRLNSLIFNLEGKVGKSGVDTLKLREQPEMFKTKLLDVLNSPNSPYKNLDKSAKDELKKAIMSYQKSEGVDFKNYKFIKFVDEPKEFERISKNVEAFNKNFRINDYI